MSATDRPWWATDEDAPSGDADPLDAHRAARRGASPDGDADPSSSGPDPDPDPSSSAGDRERSSTREAPVDDGSWWVPATEAVTRLARDLAASVTASPPRGLLDDEQVDGDRDDGRPQEPTDARTGGGDGGGHRIDACGVCPICVGLRALGEARPDLVGHLAEAARQLALAVRTVVDAAAPDDQPAAPPSAGSRHDGGRGRGCPEDLHRIDLDD